MSNSQRDRTYREAEIQVKKQTTPVKEVIYNMAKESSKSTSVSHHEDTVSSPSAD